MERIVTEINGCKAIICKENGLYHNPVGPAIVTYFSTGELKSTEYMQNNKYYRPHDLPTNIRFYKSGKTFIQEWKNQDNKLHRFNGPAKITYYEDEKTPPWEDYYVNGEYVPPAIPRMKYGRPNKPITKANLVKAIIFDRSYGLFLKEIYDNLSK